MLTLKQMAHRTSAARKVRAENVKIIGIKTGWNDDGLGFVAARTYTKRKPNSRGKMVTVKNPVKHTSVITFINKKLKCSVSCSCGDNLYRWEVANTLKGASDIEYSNGEMPFITNPKLRASLCKHLLALYWAIQDKLPKGY